MRMKIVGILKSVVLATVMVCMQMIAVTAFADTAGPVAGYNTTWTKQGGNLVSADAEGNVYSLGNESGVNGSVTVLKKFDCDGNELWSRDTDSGGSVIYADATGNVYVAGETWSGLDGNTNAGELDFFVVKYDKYGNKQWLRQRGSVDYDFAGGVCADAAGNVYVAGNTNGNLDGNINYSTWKPSIGRDWDLFLCKFDNAGNWQWTRAMGVINADTGILNTDADAANGVCTDTSGNVYITGITQVRVAPYGYFDLNSYIYVKKFDGNGVEQWTEQTYTPDYKETNGISADAAGNVYVAGITTGDLDGNTNAGYNTTDIFLMKFDGSGTKLWTRLTGTPDNDYAYSISSDAAGNVYIGGEYIVIKYDTGGVKQWTMPINSYNTSVSADAFSNVYIGGISYNGVYNSFVTKLFSGAIEINGNAQYTNNTSVTLTVPVIDENGVAQMQFSNSPDSGWSGWQDYAATAQWTLSPGDGTKTVYAKFKDTLGNESVVYSASIILDTAPPPTVITSPISEAFIAGSSCTITGTAYDRSGSGLQKVEVSVNGGETWVEATGTTDWSYIWTPMPADGRYAIKTRSTDNSGYVQNPVTSIWVTVDNTVPASVIATPANNAVLSGTTCNITGTASDGSGSGLQKVEVSADGGVNWALATGTTNWSCNWSLPADGAYTIVSRATDNAGNVQGTSTGTLVIVDKVPPTAVIVNPVNNSTISGTVYTIAGTVNVGSGTSVQKVEVSVNGGATWALATGTTSWSYNWTLPADRTYTIMSRTTDAAGIIQSPATSSAVIVNKVPPTSTITSPANGAILSGASCNITGTASNSSSSSVWKVEVSVDGGTTWALASGTSNWSYSWTPLSDGTYAIWSRATDIAGNIQSSATIISVLVDNNPPTSTITTPANGALLTGTTYSITGTASDGSGTGVQKVEISFNGGWSWTTTATGTTNWSYNWTPVEGTYNICSRATDNAGNVQSTVLNEVVIVDRTPPTSYFSNLYTGSVVRGTVNITGYAYDWNPITGSCGSGVNYIDVVIDGTPHRATITSVAGCTTNWSYAWDTTALANGSSHTIYIVAYDMAGFAQTRNPINDVILIADNIAPVISISDPVNNQTLGGTSYVIRGTASDQGPGIKWYGGIEISTDNGTTWIIANGTTSWYYTWTLPANGTYSVKARATDFAGNISTVAQITVTVNH